MINSRIIALSGRKESGKSALSSGLASINYYKIAFALPLKSLVANIIHGNTATVDSYKNGGIKVGIKSHHIDYISEMTGIPKEIVREKLHKRQFTNTRDMMQVVGTDLIREYNVDWHVNQLRRYIKQRLSENENVHLIIDDLRFPNEKDLIEELGGQCWFIVRPKFDNISNHISETSLKWQDFGDNIIINDEYNLDILRKRWQDFIYNGYQTNYFERMKMIEYLRKNGTNSTDPAYFEKLLIHPHLINYQPIEGNVQILEVAKDNHSIKILKEGEQKPIEVNNRLVMEDLKIFM